jgi:hypothetical protein
MTKYIHQQCLNREYLCRRHRIPIKCDRCRELFKHQRDFKAHQRNLIPCEIRPDEPVEGITTDIEKRLKSRKRPWPNQSEEDRWREVYQILFADEEIPSPCMILIPSSRDFELY